MIIRRPWKKNRFQDEKKFFVNQQIKSPFVFVIDESGAGMGKMPTVQALQKAQDAGFDLVEVNPKADPPIVKMMDYGQFKYEQDKQKNKQKQSQKKTETKEIRLSSRISEHDMVLRMNQAVKFLVKGNKLKVELTLKGRERQHSQKAMETVDAFALSLEKNPELNVAREGALTKQGNRFIILLVNKNK